MTFSVSDKFNITTHFLDRPAGLHPDRLAVAGVAGTMTYAELGALTNRVGNALLADGVKRGQRVLIALPDSPELIAAFLAAAKIGAIAVPVNPLSRSSDFAYYAADCGAAVAIVFGEALEEFLAAREHGVPEKLIVLGTRPSTSRGQEITPWQEWMQNHSPELQAAATCHTDPAFILYTSGSTGGPKGAVHQHKDMLFTFETFARGILNIQPGDRCFSVSKLFFAYGLGNGLYFPLGAGASTVLHPQRPRPEDVFEIVQTHRPTLFFSVPTFYAALLRAAEHRNVDFSSVRAAVSAGEALPVEVFEKFRRRFSLEIIDAIGSTEMLHMFISSVPGRIRPGSCGFPLPGYEARIVGEAGVEVASGEIGNLLVRGQSAFSEYWNKPEKTALVKQDGWVVTGDKFFCDADGYYFYCGRADDMMKIAGMWVSPAEVENAVLGHPAVAEVAVVGREAEGLTRMVAHVVLREGVQPADELINEIRNCVRARLVGFKCPQEFRFVKSLPQTATGKLQRFRLRQ